MASGYTSLQHGLSSDEPLRRTAGFRMVRMAALSKLGGGLKRFIDTVPDGDYYLQAVAVDDQHRGAGIGSTLLDYSEDRARVAGCTRIVLDAMEKNAGARRSTSAAGWKSKPNRRLPCLLPAPVPTGWSSRSDLNPGAPSKGTFRGAGTCAARSDGLEPPTS